MMSSILWERAPHTAAKHAILKLYLGAWFPKLAWTGRVLFVDGFAGPGEYLGGELGSPLIALSTAIEHKADFSNCEVSFIFVEQDEQRFDHLNRIVSQQNRPSWVKLETMHDSFESAANEILARVEDQGVNLAPAFFMVDPFGFSGMPYGLLRRIARQPRSEMLISFMNESINRWLSQEPLAPTYDALFGTTEWREAERQESRVLFLIELYVRQLKQLAKYVRVFEMRDHGNHVEYFLVYTTNSLDGLKAMKYAMWKLDPVGGFRFSDRTQAAQLTLFGAEPDYDLLRRLLTRRFAGATASVGDIEEFVLVDTPFRETHFKRKVLDPWERDGKITILSAPTGRRRFTYPPGTVIGFTGV